MQAKQIDNALILAAGAGTRMGKIGRRLPKVLWPVFEKSILELEVLYAKSMGVKNIYLNVHHHRAKMLEFLSSNPLFDDVNILVETEKIDIGGAVHNMAEKAGYKGNLLILNSDQFIFLEERVWQKAWSSFEQADALLFSYKVNSSDKYNALETKDDVLQRVALNEEFERNKPIFTYTGMALIKLESLTPSAGESRFFDTVANPDIARVVCKNIETSPYWDFGTLGRYWRSCFAALERLNSGDLDLFLRFLLDQKALLPNKASRNSYGTSCENVINLSGQEVKGCENKIILSLDTKAESALEEALKERAFIHNEIVEKL